MEFRNLEGKVEISLSHYEELRLSVEKQLADKDLEIRKLEEDNKGLFEVFIEALQAPFFPIARTVSDRDVHIAEIVDAHFKNKKIYVEASIGGKKLTIGDKYGKQYIIRNRNERG